MLLAALILGLLGSLHCLGMCGPIAFMLPLGQERMPKKLLLVTLYQAGRLFSYALMGIAFGLVGRGLQLFGVQQKLSIGIGVLMILLVLLPGKYLSRFGPARFLYTFVGKVKSGLGKALQKKTPDTYLSLGILNGLLPCGLVYMAILGAVAMGNPLEGGLYMTVFGLGTVPMMTGVIFSRSLMGNKLKFNLNRWIPAIVVVLGLFFILRGLGLGIPYISPADPAPVQAISTSFECY
ncbi:hypothetical protein SAMN04490243_1559 [Robiginitalea myxolifaciens]|uniref:Urease accessory protein UreH-like transmembrane domain-containing protein n=1 Tax=Robiginitalea myxolifaciens TaxID=400055 RepID=A0A1I6GC64_9FLAO|nr:sulfite exporter TauE/SafE family protein [Robiginitalea myxolifaciens]SFR39731.1 hypothetical protein SAMN04490243_1559 [Robiginitalea myxolifaciens]